ncbi:hypothetical protein B0H11DRAFT_1932912 [Mycena galericulata]|nr:hypothetical protein B0H11DRAFT_1932912 [Mycena galericulata]
MFSVVVVASNLLLLVLPHLLVLGMAALHLSDSERRPDNAHDDVHEHGQHGANNISPELFPQPLSPEARWGSYIHSAPSSSGGFNYHMNRISPPCSSANHLPVVPVTFHENGRMHDYNTSSVEYLGISGLGGEYLDLAYHCASSREALLAHSDPLKEVSPSTPKRCAVPSDSSPCTDNFSISASPGYPQNDITTGENITRPRSGRGQHTGVPHYLEPYKANLVGTTYTDGFTMSTSRSLATTHPPLDHWGVVPSSSLPCIAHGGHRDTVHHPSPTESELFSSFIHAPHPAEICRWPQTFNGATIAPKQPGLACLFCRTRKIRCHRPDEDNLDQRCKCVFLVYPLLGCF